MTRLLRWGLALAVAAALLIGAVLLLPFSPWMPGGTVGDIPTSAVVNGSAFNRLFPAAGPGEELVFTQEKRGFSQARLKQGGTALALLAISDTATAPEARDKFRGSAEQLKGWPLVEQGEQASALLVAERFQVKVIGQGPGLDPTQRHELLEAFDLPGLAALPQPKARGRVLAPAPGTVRPSLAPAPNPA
ncbi:hypothetical protein [Cyanobium sp. NIES-981]|uniref:hypothetical protein n=1 Tax=Cyanobium sp. NIES-981 TaxID=1851505 RepID=UPI0007DE00DA|nr:hypothetical protein [Cyanobium sp. NIES-981]SBO44695.1 conserved protein of unknown function [Cyanobium sp. NIES-981]